MVKKKLLQVKIVTNLYKFKKLFKKVLWLWLDFEEMGFFYLFRVIFWMYLCCDPGPKCSLMSSRMPEIDKYIHCCCCKRSHLTFTYTGGWWQWWKIESMMGLGGGRECGNDGYPIYCSCAITYFQIIFKCLLFTVHYIYINIW